MKVCMYDMNAGIISFLLLLLQRIFDIEPHV